MTSLDMLDHASRLRSAGLRVTAPRIAVLDVVSATPHATAEQVAGEVRRRLGSVSLQTVYDALHMCSDVGIMRRIEPAGSPVRYETRIGDNHHHVVCRGCGRIEDVDCATGEAPCLTAAEDHGFLVDEAEIIYWGTCADCRAADATG